MYSFCSLYNYTLEFIYLYTSKLVGWIVTMKALESWQVTDRDMWQNMNYYKHLECENMQLSEYLKIAVITQTTTYISYKSLYKNIHWFGFPDMECSDDNVSSICCTKEYKSHSFNPSHFPFFHSLLFNSSSSFTGGVSTAKCRLAFLTPSCRFYHWCTDTVIPAFLFNPRHPEKQKFGTTNAVHTQ